MSGTFQITPELSSKKSHWCWSKTLSPSRLWALSHSSPGGEGMPMCPQDQAQGRFQARTSRLYVVSLNTAPRENPEKEKENQQDEIYAAWRRRRQKFRHHHNEEEHLMDMITKLGYKQELTSFSQCYSFPLLFCHLTEASG